MISPRRALLSVFVWMLWTAAALAQGTPGFVPGPLSSSRLNQAFSTKMDLPGVLTLGMPVAVQPTCGNGFVFYNNAGRLGCQAPAAVSSITVGATVISPSAANMVLFNNNGILGAASQVLASNVAFSVNRTSLPIGGGGCAASPDVRSPFYVCNDNNGTSAAGYALGWEVWIGNNPVGSIASNNAVATFVYLDNTNGRQATWAANYVCNQLPAGSGGSVVQNHCQENDVLQSQATTTPLSAFNNQGPVTHAYEAVCSTNSGGSPQPCHVAYWAWAAGDYANSGATTTQPFDFAFAAARTKLAGFDCELITGDTGTYFAQGCLWDQSNSAISYQVAGTHTSVIDVSAATFTNVVNCGTKLCTFGGTGGVNSSGYLYGTLNATTFPNAPAPGFAVAWNFSAGGAEVDLWNTFTSGLPTNSFIWRQQTGVSAGQIVMSVTPAGVLTAGGGGAPLSLGAATVGTSTSQFIPTAARAIGDPVFTVQRTYNNTLGGAAPDSSTFYVATAVNFGSTINSWGNGILSQVRILTNLAASGQSYMEATRSYCEIAAGISGVFQSCWGEVAAAVSASGYVALNALEAQTANNSGVDAVGTTSWLPSQFRAAASALASCFGSNTCDWGYAINAYGTRGTQAGFICPKEQVPGATVKYGCFVAAGQVPIGLDTSLGTFSSFAIKANGFTIGNTGITLVGGASQLAGEQISLSGDMLLQPASGTNHGYRLNQNGTPGNVGTIGFIGSGSGFAGFTFNWSVSPAADDTDFLGTSTLRWQALALSRLATVGGVVATAAAPTVAAAQIGFGSTVTASTSCGSLAGASGCMVINVAGTPRNVPFY